MRPTPEQTSLAQLLPRILAGDARAVARALSVVEQGGAAARSLVAELYPRGGRALVVGVTGAPGSGKSTLVDRLIAVARAEDKRVGVLAVDPSSPFSGGALLGDRVRMGGHAGDAGVFIRSMATRGRLGGLSPGAADALVVLDAAGMDVVLLETVGVGQDEVDVMRLAAITILVLVPDAGDEVQANKAGVMEIADLFVVNKADRPDADRMVAAVEASVALTSYAPDAWRPPVLKAQAAHGTGVREVWEAVGRCRAHLAAGVDPGRRRERLEWRVRDAVGQAAVSRVTGRTSADRWDDVLREVEARRLDPTAAAEKLLVQAFREHDGHPA